MMDEEKVVTSTIPMDTPTVIPETPEGNPMSTTAPRDIRPELQCLELARKYFTLKEERKLLVGEASQAENRLQACYRSIESVQQQLAELLGWQRVGSNSGDLPAQLVHVLARLVIMAATPPPPQGMPSN